MFEHRKRKLNSVGVLTLGAVILSGCMAGKNYERPELDINGAYAVNVPVVQSQSIANISWFDLYGDPQLKQYVTEALEHNLDLQLAAARVDEARARLRVSRSALFPTVSGSISTSASPQGNSNDSNFTAGLIVGWEIDIFGRLRRLNEAQRAQLMATEAGRNAVVSSLVTQVATTWFTIRELREEEAIILRNIALQEDALELVRLLHRQGVQSDAEVQQAIGLLNSTRASLPLVIQSRLVSENILSMLIGRYPTEMPDAAPRAAAGLSLESLPLGVPSDLLARRPDVIAAEQSLHAATAAKGAAIANRFPFPTIGLSTIFGRSATELGDLFDNGNSVSLNSWGPSISLPILNFGRDQGNVEVADAQMRQALISYRQTIQTAMYDVQQARYGLNASDGQLGPLAVQVQAARRSLELQQMRFKAGVTGYLEVLDAQRQLLSTELGLERARLDRNLALLDLYRALGGGWNEGDAAR